MKASDITLGRKTSFLFKGAPGFGKTIAACSFALLGPLYLAYLDKQLPVELAKYYTEKRFGAKAKIIMDNIEFDIYGGHNAHEYLNKVIAFTSDCRYMTFVTDSVTNLTAAAVNWSLSFREPDRSKAKHDKINKSAPAMIPDFDEYKVETSLVSQAMDLQKSLPCNIIWTAHPLPGIKIEGAGASIRVTKVNPIVTYGTKVAGMIPGNFTEIYQFSKKMDYTSGASKLQYLCSTEAIGDDYAKSPLLGDYVKEFDFTDKIFYEVWKDLIDKSLGIEPKQTLTADDVEAARKIAGTINPFAQASDRWKV